MGSTAALMPQLLTLSGLTHLGSINFEHELSNPPG